MAAARLGRYADGARAFGQAADITRGPAANYNAGAMHARLGHTDSAFAWLGRAAASGFSDERLLRTDEDLASLRGSARFDSLVYRATHAPTPCAGVAERRRLDFWTGGWDVTTAGGSPAGTSSVQIVSGGWCAPGELDQHARREGTQPHDVQPRRRPVGVRHGDRPGRQPDRVSREHVARRQHRAASELRRVGEHARDRAAAYLLPVDSATVRQLGERSTDGGRTWSTTYDFLYHRRR